MWIIPGPLLTSLCVQDTEVLTSESPELSALSEQSLMWRSKPSQSQTWSRRWRRGGWLQLLSGRILRPSIGAHFAERWTSSLEGSLANRSPLPGAEEETKIPDTCGPTSPEESELSDLPLFSWRTSRGSSAQSSREITGQIPQVRRWLSMSSASWSGWVIEQRRDYSRRKRSALLTKESVVSSWRSPRVGDRFNPTQVRSLTTSSGAAWKGKGEAYRPSGQKHQIGLSDHVIAGLLEEERLNSTGSPPEYSAGRRIWRTPLAKDCKAEKKKFTSSGAAWLGEGTAYTAQGDPAQISLLDQVIPQREWLFYYLNPRWVEALMGLPLGWVDPVQSEPTLFSSRIDELRLLGNGVVPATAERAILTLLRRLLNEA